MPKQEVPIPIRLPGALAMPDWRTGAELTAGDLRLEQEYRLQRLRRHRRLVHGWGVLCGLNVAAANTGNGWDLLICPGYGISPCGDEIQVSRPYRFNLADYLWTRPIRSLGDRARIGIEAYEEATAYETVPAGGCGCNDATEKTSRLEDGFRVVVSWTPPPRRTLFDMCGGTNPPCPECPKTCELPLALIQLPGVSEQILQSAIDNFVSR